MPGRPPAAAPLRAPGRVGRLRARPRPAQPGSHAAFRRAPSRGAAAGPQAAPRGGRRRRSYQQSRNPRAHSLWKTSLAAALRRPVWVGAVVPKRHATQGRDAVADQAPDLRGGRASPRPARARPVDCSPALAFRSGPVRERGVAGAALRVRAQPSSTRCSRAAPAARRRHDASWPQAVADRRRARLSLLAQPVARQRLPVRADVLGLRARSARDAWRGGRRSR